MDEHDQGILSAMRDDWARFREDNERDHQALGASIERVKLDVGDLKATIRTGTTLGRLAWALVLVLVGSGAGLFGWAASQIAAVASHSRENEAIHAHLRRGVDKNERDIDTIRHEIGPGRE